MSGFRSALKQWDFTRTCVGACCDVYVPRERDMNPIIDKIYPEFFINISTRDGANFDGGIINKGNEWIAFIFGGQGEERDKNKRITKPAIQVWKEERISKPSEDEIGLRFKGKEIDGKHCLCLYINGRNVITIDRDTVANSSNDKYGITDSNDPHYRIGWLAENASYAGIVQVSHELNLVPTSRASVDYITEENERGRAYFKNTSIAYAFPIDKNNDYIYRYESNFKDNCDKKENGEYEYSRSTVEKVVDITSDKRKDSCMTSTIDFNRARY